jgi:cardiolipin synthase A/B
MPAGIKRKKITTYSDHNTVELIRGGSPYFTLLVAMIAGAKTSIHLQTYIYEEDETGKEVAAAMMAAAGRGVQVFLLLDGYASQGLSKVFIRKLKEAGIQFRWFEPFLRSRFFYFGRRLHHKVVVVDGVECLVGGINISNRYNDMPDDPAWMDWAIHANGQVAADLYNVCVKSWNGSGWGRKKTQKLTPVYASINGGGECLVRIRRNDWVKRQNHISHSYLEMFSYAQEQIIIMSSYFLPGHLFRKRLAAVAARGVKVKIIVTGVSDIMLSKLAERFMYRWLFRKRIEVYEYNETVLHAKIAVADNSLVTAGSYNVNNLSAYVSIELNLDVKNEAFAVLTRSMLENIIVTKCNHITPENFSTQYNILQRILQRLAYTLLRVLFFLFTFYFKQRK